MILVDISSQPDTNISLQWVSSGDKQGCIDGVFFLKDVEICFQVVQEVVYPFFVTSEEESKKKV
jgi:hypothetical protein